MALPEPIAVKPVTLEQLIALNDEIAALVRVGVPLEPGLRELGAELPGRLGTLAASLAQQMDRGQSLPEVFAAHPEAFPPVYRAVVTAGLKSGRLAVALESLAGSSRRLLDARRIVMAGLLYPLIVVLVAWGLFIFFVLRIAPVFLKTFVEVEVPGRGLLAALVGWGDSAQYWGPAVPIVVLLGATAWGILSGRSLALRPRAAGVLLGWLPWTHRMLRSFRVAMFAEVLALLVENSVPLHEGLVLAAEAVGDEPMLRSAHLMAEALQRGQRLEGQSAGSGLPPLLEWLMTASQGRAALLPALRHAADIYHRRATHAAEAARLLVPICLTVIIGGGVTLVYALTVFGSWIALLRTLAETL